MKSERFLLSAVLLALPAVAFADTVKLSGVYVRNVQQTPEEQTCRAVRALANAQGSFTGQSGRPVDGTWEWTRGSGLAAENAAGIVAVSLATALETSKGCGAEQALARFAEDRMAAHARGEFLYDPDIEALSMASKVLGVAKYHAVAREALASRYSGGSGREFVERWLLIHPRELVGFDAAMAIRAALAVGDRKLAVELADAAVATVRKWGEGTGDMAQLATSRGALLEALVRLDAGKYASATRDLVHHLLLTQSFDGTWAIRNTQATAYAVVGLEAAGETAAAEHGRRFLKLSQLEGGMWASFNDFAQEPFVGEVVHEVSAEALRAVARR